jgi:hypothetical protein
MAPLEQQQLLEALMQVALLETKALSVGIAEMIAYLQKKEHLAALGTFQGLETNSSSWAPCSKPQHVCPRNNPVRSQLNKGEPTAMTDSKLKSVVVLDPESQAYRPSAHNLSASEAVNLAEQFSNENRTAKVLDQKDRHLASDPAKCRAWKRSPKRPPKPPIPTQ